MENMRKMVLFVECGVGTKSATAYLVPENMTEEELSDYAREAACQHAESYGHYPESYRPEDDDGSTYTDDIEGWFEEYSAEEHDGQLVIGRSNTFTWNEI